MKNLFEVCLLAIVLALGIGEAFGQYVWTKYSGNPVMQSGQPGSWDSQDIYPCPVLFRDSVYHLWYTGYDGTADWRYTRSGYARSTNGITWTKHTAPVLDVGNSGAWDAYDAEACAVLYDSAQYKMWYSGYSSAQWYQQIGYATGVNETAWTKRTNPVLGPGSSGSWDVAAVMWPYVLRSSPGGGFKMWYTGWDGSKLPDGTWINYQIGYATAKNETTWTKHPLNPVLSPGPSGSWDDARVFYGAVVYDSTAHLYYMFYTGDNKDTTGDNKDTGITKIGFATSSDGISWTKFSKNPVLSPGGTGSWDAKTLAGGGVVMVRDTFRLWYTGVDANGVTRFGYATSPRIHNGVTEGRSEVPQSYMLGQNYPNPFNPSTTIKFELPKSSEVRLSVYDMLGREVSVLVNERRDAGVHEVKFDGESVLERSVLLQDASGLVRSDQGTPLDQVTVSVDEVTKGSAFITGPLGFLIDQGETPQVGEGAQEMTILKDMNELQESQDDVWSKGTV